MANGSADTTARLENWFWTQSPPGLIGEIFDDPPPRSWPDGASTRTSNVSELEQRGAAEGKIIVTMTGRRYLLGKAATHASLAAERDDAQREADELREQLEALQAAHTAPVAAGLTRNKRPRGRAPAGYGWDKQTGRWLDENGKPFERVDHPSRQRLRAENRTAALERCTEVWRGLPGCSNKKSSDRHHGKPFSKNVKLILFISGSSRRRPRPRRGGCGLRPPCVSVI